MYLYNFKIRKLWYKIVSDELLQRIQNYIKLVIFNNHFSKNINIAVVTLHQTLEFVSLEGSGTMQDDGSGGPSASQFVKTCYSTTLRNMDKSMT